MKRDQVAIDCVLGSACGGTLLPLHAAHAAKSTDPQKNTAARSLPTRWCRVDYPIKQEHGFKGFTCVDCLPIGHSGQSKLKQSE